MPNFKISDPGRIEELKKQAGLSDATLQKRVTIRRHLEEFSVLHGFTDLKEVLQSHNDTERILCQFFEGMRLEKNQEQEQLNRNRSS